MTRIDPSRIADIFRLLAADKHAKVDAKRAGTNPAQSTPSTVANPRDPELLRLRLRQRLTRLKQENVDFELLAPDITVREVLMWEFGENILNHPEFHHVAHTVAQIIQNSDKVKEQLQRLITQLVTDVPSRTA